MFRVVLDFDIESTGREFYTEATNGLNKDGLYAFPFVNTNGTISYAIGNVSKI